MYIQIDIHIGRERQKANMACIIDDVYMDIHCTILSTFLYVWKIYVLKYFKMRLLHLTGWSLKVDLKSLIIKT